jgi:SAM-dependent methyltransferase
MLNKEDEYVKMHNAEGTLWWYRILHQHVLDLIQANSASKDIQILDAGCGTGGMLSFLREKGYTNIYGFDISPYAVEACKGRTLNNIQMGAIENVSSMYPAESFDVIICNDMLYFVEDEVWTNSFNGLFLLLKKGGIIVVNLPAFSVFQGTHDISVGIQNRWTYNRFAKKIISSKVNYSNVSYFYWPFLLSPFIMTVRLIQNAKWHLGFVKQVNSDVYLPSNRINRLFYLITKLENRLPFKRFFGSSLHLCIRKQITNGK